MRPLEMTLDHEVQKTLSIFKKSLVNTQSHLEILESRNTISESQTFLNSPACAVQLFLFDLREVSVAHPW